MSESTKRHKAEAPKKLKFGIFICSTSRYQELKKGKHVEDASGDLIESLLKKVGHTLSFREIIPDDKSLIEKSMRYALDSADLDAVVFCGGTGITPSDVTIEAVSPFLEKILPGFGEIFRRLSYDKIGSAAVLSRAVAGVAKGKTFFCIPGSPDAVKLCFEKLILPEIAHIVKHAREAPIWGRTHHSFNEDIVREITPYLIEVEMPPTITLESPQVIVTGGRIKMKILGWKTIPETKYKVPILTIKGKPEKENAWLGGLTEGEGSPSIIHATIRGKTRKIPQFAIHMYDPKTMKRAGEDLGLNIHKYYDPRRRKTDYYIATMGSPAVSIAKWITEKSNITKNSRVHKQAEKILKTFKQHPTLLA